MQVTSQISKADILVVDDTPENLTLLVKMLREQGHKARPLPNGRMALQAAENHPPDLILLDIMMPDMDGYEVCRLLKKNPVLKDIPVIFISALSDTLDKVDAFSAGGVDYIAKPFRFEEVNARVKTHLSIRRMQLEMAQHNRDLELLVSEQVREITNAQRATIVAMTKLAEARDDETGKHIERTQTFCKMAAIQLRKNNVYAEEIDEAFLDNIFHASPLHDIGKVAIPDRILLKPGRLTSEEFEIMKKHTTLGADYLREAAARYKSNDFLTMGMHIARWHHERWDGTGYPDNLAGTAIPLCARIMALADVYDALRSRRTYKEPFSHAKSYQIIVDGSGTHFDPEIIKVFKMLERDFEYLRDLVADDE